MSDSSKQGKAGDSDLKDDMLNDPDALTEYQILMLAQQSSLVSEWSPASERSVVM